MKIKNFSKPFIIGEVGINHNGSVDLAKKIILLAKESNFDAVKLQKRDLDVCIPDSHKNKIRETPWGEMTYLNYKRKIEFNEKQFKEIKKFCKKINIDLFCSAFDIESLKFLRKFNFKYNKVPSALITNLEFLKAVAKQKKKTFISTGMCTMRDITKAVTIFKKYSCSFILMHCVSEYPCPEEKLNLNMIKTLKKKFKCEVGYSGHEPSLSPTLFAWSLGAEYIERHITNDRTNWGTDQSASLEGPGMGSLVTILKKAKNFYGNGVKKITLKEKEMLKKFKYW